MVTDYMDHYNALITDVIDKNNSKMYRDMEQFISETTRLLEAAGNPENKSSTKAKMVAADQTSQVPTCIVYTSAESASSVDP